ncbi:hypothetical protein Trydic_g496 [Trypoxylus dichotomus]
MKRILVLALFTFTILQGKQFPSFVQKCKLSDTNINDCLKNRAQEFSKYLADGVRAFKIPALKNFTIPEMKVRLPWTSGTYKNALYEPIYVYHADSFEMDLDKGIIVFNLSSPRASLRANYVLDGKLIQIPFHGEGVVTATAENITSSITVTGKKTTRNGKEYFDFESGRFKFGKHTIKSVYFANLFDGNVALTERINEVIFANREEMFEEFFPLLEVVMDDLVRRIFVGVFGTFSLDELFD